MAETKPPLTTSATEGPAERRRTHRIQIMMPVIVRGKNGAQPFQEDTHTVSVNANGCMVRMETRVTRTQHVSLLNPKTAEELPCTVSFLGQRHGARVEVGLEFVEPSPLFWRIAFPPEDWDPSERKRPSDPRSHAKRP